MKDSTVLKWIYNNCGKRIAEGVALTVLNAWSAVCVTLFAMLSKTVMDYAQSGNADEMFKNALFLLLLIVSQIVARICASFIEAISQGRAEIKLKTSVFRNIIYGEYANVSERHSGDLMSRLTTDVVYVSDNYVRIFPTLVGYVVRIASAAVALLALDRRFAVVFIICGIVVVVIAAVFRKTLKNLHLKVQKRDSRVRSFMQEMLENLFAVKVFGIEEKIINRSYKQQKKFYREKVRKKSFSILATISFSLAFAAGFLAAVSYGSYGILKGTMTFGTVVAIVQLVNQLQSPIVGVTSVLPSFYGMLASAQRLMEVSEISKDNAECDTSITYDNFVRIKAENVTFGYSGENVISKADFSVEKGEFIGIKGPSGAGKSTIFKLITGLYETNDGSIYVETDKGIQFCRATRHLFSVVPQGNMLFSGTVRENITLLCPDATDDEVKKAITDACAEFVYDLENGLDFVLTEDGGGISEGQAQRLAIVRALLGSGKILLMDESTSALDDESERRLLRNLKNRNDLTILFITHRQSVLDCCDREIQVSDGKIAES
ncbi:MAG: ABC transporter ATP-binding protein [Clostridia bacterium]|nr:ABC transporter ATP-binding protein [Clostridia bacterium]